MRTTTISLKQWACSRDAA
ncbi:hypothetical protein CRUP_021194 [Coryphaenoides rupestris]|nr:hypothetical protein CRUP_021194 [Coryphaenoides rupestris]